MTAPAFEDESWKKSNQNHGRNYHNDSDISNDINSNHGSIVGGILGLSIFFLVSHVSKSSFCECLDGKNDVTFESRIISNLPHAVLHYTVQDGIRIPSHRNAEAQPLSSCLGCGLQRSLPRPARSGMGGYSDDWSSSSSSVNNEKDNDQASSSSSVSGYHYDELQSLTTTQ